MMNYLYSLATDQKSGVVAGLIKFFLWMFSLAYGLGVRLLLLFFLFNPRRLPSKVISVGNITLGGTGKTCLVEYICRLLKVRGNKIAVLTRGYKRKKYPLSCQAAGYETMGDEPFMLSCQLADVPIIVDPDRIRGGRRAIEELKVDTLVLDDGMQQWRIKKDLEVVAIDATDPFGNRRLLPRGILREPLSSLSRAGIIVLTKTNLNPDIADLKAFLVSFNPAATLVEAAHQPLGFYKIKDSSEPINADALRGKIVAAFSGIGDPDSFENLLLSLGANLGLTIRFADHYAYTQKDLDGIVKNAQEKNIEIIVTTEKDAVRIKSLAADKYHLAILVLRIEIKLTHNEEGFRNRLFGLYTG